MFLALLKWFQLIMNNEHSEYLLKILKVTNVFITYIYRRTLTQIGSMAAKSLVLYLLADCIYLPNHHPHPASQLPIPTTAMTSNMKHEQSPAIAQYFPGLQMFIFQCLAHSDLVY